MSDALTVLKDFMTEMNEWENEYYDLLMKHIECGEDTELIDDQYIEKLKIILERHVLNVGKNYRKLISLNSGSPTTYNFERDVIKPIESTPKQITYLHQQSVGFKNELKITLKKLEATWKISNRQLLDENDKWYPASI
ncbi:NTF2 fold immunity protein [Pseudomonas luteola]